MGAKPDTQVQGWITEALADLPPIVTVEEAADVIRTTRRNLYRMVAAGRLHAVKAAEGGSGRLLIPRASLEKYLRRLDGAAA